MTPSAVGSVTCGARPCLPRCANLASTSSAAEVLVRHLARRPLRRSLQWGRSFAMHAFAGETLKIAPSLEQEYGAALNEAQRAIVGHAEGPLLVIAGPGSGKTFSLVLRTLNLLLSGMAEPGEIVLCTFTEKAAFELRDRIAAAARKARLPGRPLGAAGRNDPRRLQPHPPSSTATDTPLGNGYETLDELTQLLFLFEHFDEIIGRRSNDAHTSAGGRRSGGDQGAPRLLRQDHRGAGRSGASWSESATPFLEALGRAYRRYERALFAENRVDFAHLQRLVHGLCSTIPRSAARHARRPVRDGRRVPGHQLRPGAAPRPARREPPATSASSATRTRACTGSAARRSATSSSSRSATRLRPWSSSRPTTARTRRSSSAYDRWMAAADWSNPTAPSVPVRQDHRARPEQRAPRLPGRLLDLGPDARRRGRAFRRPRRLPQEQRGHRGLQPGRPAPAQRPRWTTAGPTSRRSRSRGIPAFCPRARAYFDNEEVRLMVGCFAVIFGWHGDGRGELQGRRLNELADYVDGCLVELGRPVRAPHPLAEAAAALCRRDRRPRARPTRSTSARPTTSTGCSRVEPFAERSSKTRTGPATSPSSRSS